MKTISDDLFLAIATWVDTTRAGTQEQPAPPPVLPPPPPPPVANTTYPVAKLTSDDKLWLYRMAANEYPSTLRNLPGSHELHYDMLTNALGLRYSDAVPQPAGTMKDPALKLAISQAINFAGSDNAALVWRFNVNTYVGPCRPIYDALVRAKLAGRA